MPVTKTHLLIIGGVVALLIVAGLAYWFAGGSPDVKEDVARALEPVTCKPIETVTVTAEDFTFGSAGAPLTLVEYASQTCSHCAAYHNEVFPKINETYIKPGWVRFVFREFQRNRVDLAASLLGRCLGRDAFIPFTDSLLENQAEWMAREDQDVVAGLKEMTRRAGMSEEAFDACLKNEAEVKRLLDIKEKATKDYCLGGTPVFLLNGKVLEPKAQTFERIDEILRAELKKRGVTIPAPAAAPDETPAAPAR